MNQFYLYDKTETGAYNRARLKADFTPVSGAGIGAGNFLFF
jgi:hypothetical protein